MTPSIDILQQLRRDWAATSHSAISRHARDLLCEHHPGLGLDTTEDMDGVLRALDTRSGRSALDKARILEALLAEANTPYLRRALLQTLLPGVVSTCRQLRFGDGIIDDPSETLTMAISMCDELLSDWAGQRRAYAGPDILSALRGRLRRWLLKAKEARRQLSLDGSIDVTSEAGTELLTRLEQLRGGRFDRLVRLTYARVFEGISLRDLARADHSSPRALQTELQIFALQQLLS